MMRTSSSGDCKLNPCYRQSIHGADRFAWSSAALLFLSSSRAIFLHWTSIFRIVTPVPLASIRTTSISIWMSASGPESVLLARPCYEREGLPKASLFEYRTASTFARPHGFSGTRSASGRDTPKNPADRDEVGDVGHAAPVRRPGRSRSPAGFCEKTRQKQ